MKILVHGATGAQGGPVAKALHDAGHKVVGAARKQSDDPIPCVAASLDDQGSLERAYANADALFLHLPIPSDAEAPGRWAQSILGALSKSKVKRIVFSTSGASLAEAGPDPMLQERFAGMTAFHEGLQGAADTVVALTPRLFLENLLLPFVSYPLVEDGVLAYPMADDKPISWISHNDMAQAAVLAMDEATDSGVFDMGYPAINGHELAEKLGAGLGRSVTYEAISPEAYIERASPLLGVETATGIGALYRAFATDPTLAIAPDASQLGAGARPGIDAWAKENLLPS